MKKDKENQTPPRSSGISQHFFLHFTICLFVIFVMIFVIQWSVTTWFARQYETSWITDNLVSIRQAVTEAEREHREILLGLKQSYSETNFRRIQRMELPLPPQSMFYVFGENNELLYGQYWDEFFRQLFINSDARSSFIFADGASLYRVSADFETNPVSGNLYKYYLISIYREPNVPSISFQTYTFTHLQNSNDRHLSQIYRQMIRETHISELMIYPIDDMHTFGVYSQFDGLGNVVVVYLLQYQRDILLFLKRFYFIIIGILLGAFSILSIISFSFISNRIFNPLWHLISKMKSISQKPQLISPVSKNTQGEILEIYDFFNEMANSINNYQKELAKSNELFEKINIGLFWLDERRQIKHCNKAFRDILELKNTTNIRLSDILPDIFYKEKWKNQRLEIAQYQYCPSAEPNPQFPSREGAGSGQKLLSISILAYHEFNETGFLGIITDITEESKQASIRRSLELELIKINRLSEVGKRIQGIVHNLNSPLNSVIGYAQLLNDDLVEKEEITKIIKAAKSMHETVRQLLNKTIDDSIAMPIPVNLNKLLQQELHFCQHNLFFKHNVQLSTQFADDIPEVPLVYGDISQVFQTLFNNALEAMADSEVKVLTVASFVERCSVFGVRSSETSTIVPPVKAGGEGGGIQNPEHRIGFSVRDTGTGMTPDVKANIFETGFSTKTMTHSSGFGIGLPLAKSIIDKLGGTIEVTTEPNKGSEFKVMLPCSSQCPVTSSQKKPDNEE